MTAVAAITAVRATRRRILLPARTAAAPGCMRPRSIPVRSTVTQFGPLHNRAVNQALDRRIDMVHLCARHEGTRPHFDEQSTEDLIGKAVRDDPNTGEVENDRTPLTQQILEHSSNPSSTLPGAEIVTRFISHFNGQVASVVLEPPFDVIVGWIVRLALESEGLVEQCTFVQSDSACPSRASGATRHEGIVRQNHHLAAVVGIPEPRGHRAPGYVPPPARHLPRCRYGSGGPDRTACALRLR